LLDGRCETCGDYTYSNSDGKECIKDACDYSLEIMNTTGKCVACEDYTYPLPINDTYSESRECIFDTCDSLTQILLTTGRCQACEENFGPDDNGRNCVFKLGTVVEDKIEYLSADQYPAVSETSVRTELKMDGTVDDFDAGGGASTFKNSLSSELGIDPAAVNILNVVSGSIVVTYDLVADDVEALQALAALQTETLATR
jgi:hypothetical protein